MVKPWQYDPRWGTVLVLDGCQFGLEVDGRCNMMLCKFRTTKDLAPEKPNEICRVLCPREVTYKLEQKKKQIACNDGAAVA